MIFTTEPNLLFFFQNLSDRKMCRGHAKILQTKQLIRMWIFIKRIFSLCFGWRKLQTFKSLPEYPSVIFAIASKSTSSAISSFAKITLKIFDLFAESGRLTINLHRRSTLKRRCQRYRNQRIVDSLSLPSGKPSNYCFVKVKWSVGSSQY